MKQARWLPALSLLLLPDLAHAHCGCNDSSVACLCPSLASAQGSGEFSVGILGSFADYERVVGKGTDPHGTTYDLRSATTQLNLGYRATDKVRVQLNVPVLVRETSGADAPPTDDGLGDASIFGF